MKPISAWAGFQPVGSSASGEAQEGTIPRTDHWLATRLDLARRGLSAFRIVQMAKNTTHDVEWQGPSSRIP